MIPISEKGKGAIREKFKFSHLWRKRLNIHKKYLKAITPINYKNISLMFPVKDQGSSSSCGGQAFASALECAKYLRDGTIVPLSAKDIYSNVFLPGGGSQESDLVKQVENDGTAFESDIPSYENLQPPTEEFMEKRTNRSGQVYDNALQQIVAQSYTFNGNDINQVKQAIDTGVTTCALLGNNACWTTANGVVEIPETTDWGHFLHLVEYFTISDADDTAVKSGQMTMETAKQRYLQGLSKYMPQTYVEAKNSWGKEAGDPNNPGYYYIPAEYFSGGRVYGEYVLTLQPQGYTISLLEKIIQLYQNIIDKLKNNT